MATIQGVYIALFGRPADPSGLAFFNEETGNGANLTAIGDLSSTDEYKDRFKDLSNIQIIKAIYQSLFNRDPEDAGLEFFAQALTDGTFTINNIAIAILDGAQGDDKAIIDNKLIAAQRWTDALDTAVERASYSGENAADEGRAFLAGIDKDEDSIPSSDETDTKVKALVDAGAAGNTITLTAAAVGPPAATGLDVVSPTATLKSSNLNDTINATTAGQFAADDKINGSFGTDTLNATIAANVTTNADTLVSVENLFIKATAAVTLDVADTDGLKQVWNDGSTEALTVDNLTLGTVVGVKGGITAGKATTFNFEATGGSSDSATLALSAATANTAIAIDDIETLTIANSGTSNVVVSGADVEALAISGSGKLTLDASAMTTIETVDASAASGQVNLDITGLNNLGSYEGGSGIDCITVNTAGNTEDLAVKGNDGNDIFKINSGNGNEHTIEISGGDGSDTFKVQGLGNINDAADVEDSLITITDFSAGDDELDVKALGMQDKVLGNTALNTIASAATLQDAVEAAAGATDASKWSVFEYNGDSYIFVNDGAAGLTVGDGLIKLTGVSTDDFNDDNFMVMT